MEIPNIGAGQQIILTVQSPAIGVDGIRVIGDVK